MLLLYFALPYLTLPFFPYYYCSFFRACDVLIREMCLHSIFSFRFGGAFSRLNRVICVRVCVCMCARVLSSKASQKEKNNQKLIPCYELATLKSFVPLYPMDLDLQISLFLRDLCMQLPTTYLTLHCIIIHSTYIHTVPRTKQGSYIAPFLCLLLLSHHMKPPPLLPTT